MKKLKTNFLFSQFKFLNCPKQGKGKAILVILQSEKINIKIIYSKRLYIKLRFIFASDL